MAKVGAQRAAELTGRSKSTVQRAMKAGKLSYEVDSNGRRVIDVSELERAFGLMPMDGDTVSRSNVEAELEKATQMLELERMKMRIRMLEDQIETAKSQIEDLKEQRDQWQKQAQQVLITSQYSQKQAEELKEEIKERERRARARRLQHMEQRGQQAVVSAEKTGDAVKPGTLEQIKKDLGIQSLWLKIRGQQTQKPADEKTESAETAQQAA